MQNKNGNLDAVQVLFAAVLVLILGLSAYFLFEVAHKDNPPLVVFGDAQVQSGRFFPGEIVATSWDFCRASSAPATIYPVLVDGQIRDLESVHSNALSPECRNGFIRLVPLPDDIPPGEYFLRFRIVYDTRIFFDIIPLPRTVTVETMPFVILEG